MELQTNRQQSGIECTSVCSKLPQAQRLNPHISDLGSVGQESIEAISRAGVSSVFGWEGICFPVHLWFW